MSLPSPAGAPVAMIYLFLPPLTQQGQRTVSMERACYAERIAGNAESKTAPLKT